MDLETLRDLPLCCAILDSTTLVAWFLAVTCFHDRTHRLHGRWFRLAPDERFDLVSHAGMGLYRIGVVLFNLAPWRALEWKRHAGA